MEGQDDDCRVINGCSLRGGDSARQGRRLLEEAGPAASPRSSNGRRCCGARSVSRASSFSLPRVSAHPLLFVVVGLVMAYFTVPPLFVLFVTSSQATTGLRVTGLTVNNYQNLFGSSGAT